MKNPFEAFFRQSQGETSGHLGGAATKIGDLLNGADPDGQGPLVMPHGPQNHEPLVPSEDPDYIARRNAAMREDGGTLKVLVNPDATTGSIPRVGADGYPVEKD